MAAIFSYTRPSACPDTLVISRSRNISGQSSQSSRVSGQLVDSPVISLRETFLLPQKTTAHVGITLNYLPGTVTISHFQWWGFCLENRNFGNYDWRLIKGSAQLYLLVRSVCIIIVSLSAFRLLLCADLLLMFLKMYCATHSKWNIT